MHILKQTMINWYKEHTKFAYIVGGIILFPLAVGAIIALVGLFLIVFSALFGKMVAVALLILMPVGAVLGKYFYEVRKDG